MWRSRIFWRLFGTYGVLWLASIGVLGVIIVNRVERLFVEQMEDRLRSRVILLREAVRAWPADPPDLQRRVEELERQIETRITLIAEDGTVLADSQADPRRHTLENLADSPEVRAARAEPFGVSERPQGNTLRPEMMYVAVRTDAPAGPVAFVRVALSLGAVRGELAGLRGLVWSAVAATAVAGLALAFWLSRRMALPLNELTRAARRIAGGSYGYQADVSGGGEIGALARAFNRMSERLAGQFAQLAEDREQLRAILGGMVEGVVALDAHERILFVNDRAAQLLEFTGEQAIGRKLWQVVRRRALQEVVRRVLAGPDVTHEEMTWSGPRSRSLTVHAARLPGAPPRGVVLVLHDTSELRRLERMRQEFVANVSHELKTPLSVIKACIETLMDGAIDDVEHRGTFLERVEEQANRLHALILDLLSLARIESGVEAFEFEEVPLEPVVHACLERHRARAEAKGQELVANGKWVVGSGEWAVGSGEWAVGSGEWAVGSNKPAGGNDKARVDNSRAPSAASDVTATGSENPPPNPLPTPHSPLPTPHSPLSTTSPLPATHSPLPTTHSPLSTTHFPLPTIPAAWADEEAVGQILDNLVDNAVKYTPAGGRIRVGCWAEDGQVCLEVADNGIGIPEQDLPRIFERFYRVDKARSRELGGTGLGLSIVKHLVQAMHGTVQATSRVGEGTSFVIRLPRVPAA